MTRPHEGISRKSLGDASQDFVERVQALLNGVGNESINVGHNRYDVSRNSHAAAIIRRTNTGPLRTETLDVSDFPGIIYISSVSSRGKEPKSVTFKDSAAAVDHAERLVRRLERDVTAGRKRRLRS